MATEQWTRVWERVRAGKHAVVLGTASVPPAPSDLTVLRVQCAALGPGASPLEHIRRQMAQRLGEAMPAAVSDRMPLEAGLRHRFLGETPGPAFDVPFVEACQRLATAAQRRVVLVFEAIDQADETTVLTLSQLLQRPGMLPLPLLLTIHSTPQGRIAELIYLICRDEGAVAMSTIHDTAPTAAEATAYDWSTLPPAVLRVLRAGAVMGATFDILVLARLLEESPGWVLEQLQWAVDAGVPLVDQGQGQVNLPAELARELQESMLPSLAAFWHTRLGELLSSVPPQETAAHTAPPRTPASSAPEPALQAAQPATNYADLFAAPEPEPHTPAASTAAPEQTAAPSTDPRQMTDFPVPPSAPTGDPLRAAAHLQAAGRLDEAVGQYLTAIREAAARGDTRRAYSLVEQTLPLLDTLPNSPSRLLLRAQLWLERGRLQWHGALLGTPFTLHDALRSLETAATFLPREVPPELTAQLAAVTAGVCYDLGDQTALRRAIQVLTAGSHQTLKAGQPLLAARLLNDQAAVYIRLGDPVRATQLLAQSREIFTQHLHELPDDPVALEELAESDHLLARLPLHVPLRQGREAEAYERGLEHARAAERTYRGLSQPRQLARVWETMGRLTHQQGRFQEAYQLLATTLELQRQLGDVTGLARSTAALAELCVQTGQLGDAVTLLSNSIALNADKGSPIGLAFNRQTFQLLTHSASQLQGPDAERFRTALGEVEQHLAQAEAALGRVELSAHNHAMPSS
ncbi:MAG: tetratricopeptide repeat protein [Candidatus Tectimicrobiota bacterium]